MLLDSHPTPLDLRFNLFRFPVRVHPLFWLIMALLGGDDVLAIGPEYLLIWVACGFVSILAHELGHAVVIRYYGSPSAIVLTGFGGYAENPYPPAKRWKRIVIALAGPAAGFLFLAALVGSELATGWAAPGQPKPLRATYHFLFIMLLFWNLFNLLPIWPLDGGRVCRELGSLAGARRPDAVSLGISLATAGLLAVYGVMIYFEQNTEFLDRIVPWWLRPTKWMTLWFILFAVQSFLLLQEANKQSFGGGWQDDSDDDRPPWRR